MVIESSLIATAQNSRQIIYLSKNMHVQLLWTACRVVAVSQTLIGLQILPMNILSGLNSKGDFVLSYHFELISLKLLIFCNTHNMIHPKEESNLILL